MEILFTLISYQLRPRRFRLKPKNWQLFIIFMYLRGSIYLNATTSFPFSYNLLLLGSQFRTILLRVSSLNSSVEPSHNYIYFYISKLAFLIFAHPHCTRICRCWFLTIWSLIVIGLFYNQNFTTFAYSVSVLFPFVFIYSIIKRGWIAGDINSRLPLNISRLSLMRNN